MDATVADLNPKTLENAKRQFVELYGSALVMNTYLKIALVLVSLVALGLLALNFHTTAKYSGVSSRSNFHSMVDMPKTAWLGTPFEVERKGIAW